MDTDKREKHFTFQISRILKQSIFSKDSMAILNIDEQYQSIIADTLACYMYKNTDLTKFTQFHLSLYVSYLQSKDVYYYNSELESLFSTFMSQNVSYILFLILSYNLPEKELV